MSANTDARRLLLLSAARLYSLGVDLEGAREDVRRLAASPGTPGLREAAAAFLELREQWRAAEAEHLRLRDELAGEK